MQKLGSAAFAGCSADVGMACYSGMVSRLVGFSYLVIGGGGHVGMPDIDFDCISQKPDYFFSHRST